jgi:hypothetical protein
MMNKLNQFCVLYLEIGRGHPFYLDGIIDALGKDGVNETAFQIRDLFSLSRGISLAGWKAVRRLYRFGARGGFISAFYNSFRKRQKIERGDLSISILGRDIQKYFSKHNMPIIVSHPMLVPILADIAPVYYQHGELACPEEAAVISAEKIFVPTEWTADCLFNFGVPREKIIVTGLCIEDNLIKQAETCFLARRQRYQSNIPLTAAFYSSGAEPPHHVRAIIAAAQSLSKSGYKSIIFCRREGRLAACSHRIKGAVQYISSSPNDKIIIVEFANREEESDLTAKLFPQFDILIAPAHERSNWAAGLGLPIFVLGPDIGTFAPINHWFLLEQGVAFDLHNSQQADELGTVLDKLRQSGDLSNAAQRGFGRYRTDGFMTIKNYFIGDREESR